MLIVFPHWGVEYTRSRAAYQETPRCALGAAGRRPRRRGPLPHPRRHRGHRRDARVLLAGQLHLRPELVDRDHGGGAGRDDLRTATASSRSGLHPFLTARPGAAQPARPRAGRWQGASWTRIRKASKKDLRLVAVSPRSAGPRTGRPRGCGPPTFDSASVKSSVGTNSRHSSGVSARKKSVVRDLGHVLPQRASLRSICSETSTEVVFGPWASSIRAKCASRSWRCSSVSSGSGSARSGRPAARGAPSAPGDGRGPSPIS